MNHSAEEQTYITITDRSQRKKRPYGAYLILAAMPVYSVVAYGRLGAFLGGIAALLASAVSYLLAVYIYYGIARLAYVRHTYLLWGGVLAAVILAYSLSGLPGTWILLTGWAMLLLAGAVTGRMTRAGYLQGQVYTIGAVVVAVFFVLQSLPMWAEFLKNAPQLGEALTGQWEQWLLGMGYGPDVVHGSLDQSRRLFDIMIRLFPAATVLGALLQFTIGYLAFVRWAGRGDPLNRCLVPVVFWRVPFGFAPVILIAMLARFLGGESLQVVADNALVIFAAYYCVAGLALMEYYLRKLRVSMLMKVLFYVLLFFTQLAGLLLMALVGFIDSFADWRRVRTQETT